VAPYSVAVKLQLACFEQYGVDGIRAFTHVLQHARERGLLVVADAKRGDIGISAQAYSAAFIGRPPGLEASLDGFGVDAVTVNPLFGSEGMEPFLEDCREFGAGIFVLVKTSNPGAADLQDIVSEEGNTVAERLAALTTLWGKELMGDEGYSSVGAVIGATNGDEIGKLRSLMPRTFFLLPGYGAQGATASDVAPAFDSRGLGALVTASRSIIYAGSGEDFGDSAAASARAMRDELWRKAGDDS